jgi:hypothetical protein
MKTKVLALCVPLIFLGACQSGTPDQASSAVCDQPTMETTIGMFLHESQMEMTSFDSLKCSGDWAYAAASVMDAEGTASNETYLFQRTSGNWVLKAPETVCGSATSDGARPADTEVPVDLWSQACTTF